MLSKEVRRFLDSMFDGSVAGLMAHLADTDALSLDDLKEVEKRLGVAEGAGSRGAGRRSTSGRKR